jgi:hypothetical protein
MAAAQAMVRLGLRDDGYRYVNIDDGWWLQRGAKGIRIRTNLYPSARLPDGNTSLGPCRRLHAMGLKAGIYTDIGYNTCSQRWEKTTANLPVGTLAEREVGSLDHQEADVRAFSRWGFDLVKVDACGIADFGADSPEVMSGTYRALGPIMLRDRPAASDTGKVESLYAGFAKAVKARPDRPASSLDLCMGRCRRQQLGTCLWSDVADKFRISTQHGRPCCTISTARPRSLFAGPGHWNDPDMLEVGNGEFDSQPSR